MRGPLHLASSCLQGQRITDAVQLCESLGVAHLQLCPGNLAGDSGKQAASRLRTRTHHGFSWSALQTRVWNLDGSLAVRADSVHPPRRTPQLDVERWWRRLEAGEFADTALEVMYPGYVLGDEQDLERVLDLGTPLAVDVSHLHLMHAQGVLGERVLRRVAAATQVIEVHVSDNDGRADQHRPIGPDTFWLAWALERQAAGLPLVLECYLHRLTHDQRRAQLEHLGNS